MKFDGHINNTPTVVFENILVGVYKNINLLIIDGVSVRYFLLKNVINNLNNFFIAISSTLFR